MAAIVMAAIVMAALVAAIHVFIQLYSKDVDDRI
jgi:hypothetical protein